MSSIKNRYCFLAIIALCCSFIQHLSAMNIFRPDNILIRPEYDGKKPFQFSLFAEGGIGNVKGFDSLSDRVNPLAIWQPEQDAITMCNTIDSTSELGQLSCMLTGPEIDLINRFGQFSLCADLDLRASAAIAARFFFCDTWSISTYLPFYAMRLDNLMFQGAGDPFLPQEVGDFVRLVSDQGNGLALEGWKRSGVGDWTTFLDWFRDFPQHKPLLKNVRINWRLGLTVPTGKLRDENLLFALPFGTDGAFALPFGLGLDLTLGVCFKVGMFIDLIHTFGNTRCRRIKVTEDQTELLLLNSARAYKDHGLTQQFSLWLQMYKIYQGFSCKVGYQFFKKGEDTIALKTNAFSTEIANSAESLREWISHSAIVHADYDFGVHLSEDAPVRPKVSLFARIPFNGKRTALATTIGAIFTIDF